MKKNYFSTLFAALMLFVAMPAKAQMSSVSDFFGKYTFTANVEMTDAGKALGITFPNECEVVIAKCSDNIYDGQLQGLPGATGVQKINGIDTEKNVLKITNPNQGYPWGNLYMSDGNGMNPYGRDSMYNDVEYAYDPETKAISMPDFTVVSMNSDFSVATVVVKFTGAKLTLVEAENIEIADLSGDWHFTATPGGFNTMDKSTLPTEWDMTLTATNENNSTYDISLRLGDFAPLALTATFDGVQLVIPFNETYFDEENKIGIVNMYGEARPGEITFNLGSNENMLSITSGMTIAQDSISEDIKGGYLQWYMAGNAKREVAEENVPFTWDGTYTVKANNVQIYNQDYNFPAEFEVEIEYNEGWGMYLVTKIFGMDVVALNYGGILVTPSEDNPNMAEIEVGAKLQSVVAGESYLYLMNMNATDEWNLQLTRNEDGTFTMENFCITYYKNGEEKHSTVAYYTDVTAEKEGEEEAEPFTWDGTYTVKANNVQIYNQDYNFPAEFEVEIEYNEGWGMYLVTKIFGMDVVALNYGGILVTPSEDNPNMAEIEVGAKLQSVVAGESYLYLMNMNATDEWNLQLTRNEDGTFTMENFCITYYKNGEEKHSTVAYYTDVTAEKKSTTDGIENTVVENNTVEGIFDLFGRKLDAITAPGLYIVNGNKVLVK